MWQVGVCEAQSVSSRVCNRIVSLHLKPLLAVLLLFELQPLKKTYLVSGFHAPFQVLEDASAVGGRQVLLHPI